MPRIAVGAAALTLVLASVGLTAYLMQSDPLAKGPVTPRSRPIAAAPSLAPNEQRIIGLFKQLSPAVVFITTLAVQRDFLSLEVDAVPRGNGSGFVWDQRGHIVTNYHVIMGADAVTVGLADRSTYTAKVVGLAPEFDLAVLRIEAPEDVLSPVPVGTSHDLQVGQSVLAIGNPFGLDHSLTTGVVSALGRTIRAVTGRMIEGVIQTDASINPGNSGGPLLDSGGRLIGVNTAIQSPSGVSAGIGFAVPVDTVDRVVGELITNGRLARAHMGVQVADDVIARRLGADGVLILGLEADGGAAKAGLRGTRRDGRGRLVLGDVLIAVEGVRVRRNLDLLRQLTGRQAGESVEVVIRRGRQTLKVPVTLDAPLELPRSTR